MKKIVLIFVTLFASSILTPGCNGNTSISNKIDSTTYLLVVNAIQTHCKQDVEKVSIKEEFLKDVNLYFSDPSYIQGPSIDVNMRCWVLRYSTTSLNDDGSIKYKDNYTYYFPKGDSIAFYLNTYNGNNYHGGRTTVLTSSKDKRFSDIKPPLHGTHDKITRVLCFLLNDSVFSSIVESEMKDYYNRKNKDKDEDIRNFTIFNNGFCELTVSDEKHLCYNTEVSFSEYKNNEWLQTIYHTWYFDFFNHKVFFESIIREKRKPGEPYRGILTSTLFERTIGDLESKILSIYE